MSTGIQTTRWFVWKDVSANGHPPGAAGADLAAGDGGDASEDHGGEVRARELDGDLGCGRAVASELEAPSVLQ